LAVIDFAKFVYGVTKGLLYALTHDVDVFLLGVSAVLLSFHATRWVGIVFLVYLVFRRLDQYIQVLTSKADLFFRLMSDEDSSQLRSRTHDRS
jgi:hypothetical protein